MHRELRLSRAGGRLWALLQEEGVPLELNVEGPSAAAALGALFRGVVTEVRDDLGLAFVDLGDGGPAAALPLRREESTPRRPGSAVLVQVTREAVAGKGPRVSDRPRLHSRRATFAPLDADRGGGGVRPRHEAASDPDDALRREGERLRASWADVAPFVTAGPAPGPLAVGPGTLDRTLAALAPGIGRIVTGDPGLAAEVRAALDPSDGPLVAAATGRALVEHDDVFERAAVSALDRWVELPDGARLCIEPTAAFVAVDVDSAGSRRARAAVDRDAIRTLARHLRLRSLGGPVVVDLIDDSGGGRATAADEARRAFASDPWRVRVAGVDRDGLLRVVRERRRVPLASRLLAPCECCGAEASRPAAAWLALRLDAAARRHEAAHGTRGTRARLDPAAIRRVRDEFELGASAPWRSPAGTLELVADDGVERPVVD